jgi:hypothetical protein
MFEKALSVRRNVEELACSCDVWPRKKRAHALDLEFFTFWVDLGGLTLHGRRGRHEADFKRMASYILRPATGRTRLGSV